MKKSNRNALLFSKENKMELRKDFRLPKWDDIPDIDLYLDQVISLIDSYLSPFMRENTDEPILTKTMVNNYVKHRIIDAPIKKKYCKESVCCLIAICILKSVYSMTDIALILQAGFSNGDNRKTYTRFCNAIEKAVECAFEGKPFTDDSSTTGFPYLMQNIAQSFAGKIYTLEYCLTQKNPSVVTAAIVEPESEPEPEPNLAGGQSEEPEAKAC